MPQYACTYGKNSTSSSIKKLTEFHLLGWKTSKPWLSLINWHIFTCSYRNNLLWILNVNLQDIVKGYVDRSLPASSVEGRYHRCIKRKVLGKWLEHRFPLSSAKEKQWVNHTINEQRGAFILQAESHRKDQKWKYWLIIYPIGRKQNQSTKPAPLMTILLDCSARYLKAKNPKPV